MIGLRKTDVDLEVGVVMVRRSYDRITTKGRRSDAIPIAAELRPYLEHAIRVSPSELVFPRDDGTMHPETTQLEMPLRRALRRAGLVSGYRHKCRKKDCGYVLAATDAGVRACPRDNHQLWVTSVVRPIRFHDLRHTTGSLLTMRGANSTFVQRIMRHSDPRMTERYSHLDPDYLHGQMDALMRFETAKPDPSREPAAAIASGAFASDSASDPIPFVTRLLPEAQEGDPGALSGLAASLGNPLLTRERDTGFEPATFSLGSKEGGLAPRGTTLQASEKIGNRQDAVLHESPRIAPIRSPFATRLLPGSRTAPERLAVLRGGRDGLLSVREAAEQLGLCTATVYGLCADKALPHVRILNAVRIAPADLAAFIAGRRVGKEEGVVPGSSNGLQVEETIETVSGDAFHKSQPEGTISRSFAAGLLLRVDDDEPPLLSVREVARLLGLSTATVYALCAEGALPTVRILNTIRFRSADVRSFIMSRASAKE